MPRLGAKVYRTNPRRRVADTVRLIGEGIRRGSEHVPLRLHAGRVASRADGHKDYYGQLEEIYADFRNRWRYVRDPEGLEMVANGGPALFGLVAGFYNTGPRDHGYGDCSHAAAYLGAAARSVGFPVRLVTTSRPGAPKAAQSHVYAEAWSPGRGWIPMDPVAHPLPFGQAPAAGTRIIWDLYGRTVEDTGPGLPTMARPAPIAGSCPRLGDTSPESCAYRCGPERTTGRPTPGAAEWTPEAARLALPVVEEMKAATSSKIADLEARLAALPDDAQTANIDLKNTLEKQQAALRTLSAVSKMMHDTALAVTRKIGDACELGDQGPCFTDDEIRVLKLAARILRAVRPPRLTPKPAVALPPLFISPSLWAPVQAAASEAGKALGDRLQQLQADLETVRNKRQEYQSMFSEYDQKANQLFNILSTVMQSMQETRSGVSRNI